MYMKAYWCSKKSRSFPRLTAAMVHRKETPNPEATTEAHRLQSGTTSVALTPSAQSRLFWKASPYKNLGNQLVTNIGCQAISYGGLNRRYQSQNVLQHFNKCSICAKVIFFRKHINISITHFERKTLCPDTSRKTSTTYFRLLYFPEIFFIFFFENWKLQFLTFAQNEHFWNSFKNIFRLVSGI